MLEVRDLKKTFVSGVVKKRVVHAVDGVSFTLAPGHTQGIVGNSGCGKSTIAKILLSLVTPDSGSVLLNGREMIGADRAAHKAMTRKIQIIFQHPENSLDPAKRLRASLTEPMRIHRMYDREGREKRLLELLDLVDLKPDLLERYPHQISGGEAQRVMIARALTLDPEILILDEPTSMLDVSIQAQVMCLLRSLQARLGLSYLFISHDLDVVRYVCDEVAVMSEGRFVETGQTESVITAPKHPLTRQLVDNFRFTDT